MSSTGAGYDYSCGTFSPDGRIFQIDYAIKAVENSGTAIGLKCTDGIVLAVEKPMKSRMLVAGSNRRCFAVDTHVGVAVTGLPADGRQIVNRAREEASSYDDTYGHKAIPSVLANRLAMFVHFYTTHGSLRPFGTTALLAAYDQDIKSPELYMIDPSGLCFRYFGCAAGKGAQAAKTEIEKLFTKREEAGITVKEAVQELANIMYLIRDPTKDKPFELEMGWLTEASGWKYQSVPSALVAEADSNAREAILASGATLFENAPGEDVLEQPVEAVVGGGGGAAAMETDDPPVSVSE